MAKKTSYVKNSKSYDFFQNVLFNCLNISLFQTADIKRANNLYTNDSLFLKEYLWIPIVKSPMQSPDSAISMTNGDLALPSSSKDLHVPTEIVTRKDINRLSRSSTRDSMTSSTNGVEQVNDITAKDFLSQFDSSLSSIKDSLQKLEETTR